MNLGNQNNHTVCLKIHSSCGYSLCCPAFSPQMTGTVVPAELAVKVSVMQSPRPPPEGNRDLGIKIYKFFMPYIYGKMQLQVQAAVA